MACTPEAEDSEVVRTLAARADDPRAYADDPESASGMQQMGLTIGSPRLYEDCGDLSLGPDSAFEHNNNNCGGGGGGCVVPYANEPTATLLRSSQTLLPYCIFSPAAAAAAGCAPFHTLSPAAAAQLQQQHQQLLASGAGAHQFPPLTFLPGLEGSGAFECAASSAAAAGPYATLHTQASPSATINPYSVQYMLQPQLVNQLPAAASNASGKRSAFTPPSRRRGDAATPRLVQPAALGFQPIDAAPTVHQQQSGRHTAVQLYGGADGAQATSVSYELSGRHSEGRCPAAKSYALVKGEFV